MHDTVWFASWLFQYVSYILVFLLLLLMVYMFCWNWIETTVIMWVSGYHSTGCHQNLQVYVMCINLHIVHWTWNCSKFLTQTTRGLTCDFYWDVSHLCSRVKIKSELGLSLLPHRICGLHALLVFGQLEI